MERRNFENVNVFTISVVTALVVPLTVFYHIAFGQVYYTALVAVVGLVVGWHMLSPFTPPGYKKFFDLTVAASMLLLVLLGVFGR